MNISGVIVRVRPDKLAAVREGLAALPGVEICADAGDGRLVVTIEDVDAAGPADRFIQLHHIDGVLAVSLVYQFDDSAPEEAHP